MLTGHDHRQVERMKSRLLLYEQEKISLGTLVADLDFLIEALKDCDVSWRGALRREWGALEEVNAVVLDRGTAMLDQPLEQVVDQATEAMQALLADVERCGTAR